MRIPIAPTSLLLAALPLLGGCATEFQAELVLPFEALPETSGDPPCRVLIGRLGSAESDLEKSQPDAGRSTLLHERLDYRTEELGPGQQVTGVVTGYGFRWIWQRQRAPHHWFRIYASCLAEDGLFDCRRAPMEKGSRSAVRCPYERFAFEQGEPSLPEGSGIVAEYTPLPCSRRRDIRGLVNRTCGRGWSILLHRIRWDIANGPQEPR